MHKTRTIGQEDKRETTWTQSITIRVPVKLYTSIHSSIHYITLHSISITLHYITLHTYIYVWTLKNTCSFNREAQTSGHKQSKAPRSEAGSRTRSSTPRPTNVRDVKNWEANGVPPKHETPRAVRLLRCVKFVKS